MRTINATLIEESVEKLFLDANMTLPKDLEKAIKDAAESGCTPLEKETMSVISDNLTEARKYGIPICQDTGMAVLFAEIGRDVHIDGNFEEAVNRGVKKAYFDGKLRCSVVSDPLFDRKNTEDNTPAIIYTSITEGDKIKITALPKGFGSENKSRIKMFNPSAKPSDIVDFVVEAVKMAGSMPCPPIVVGVGIGGSFDYCAYLSKKALARDIFVRNSDKRYASLEKEMLEKINSLGIGPQGFGGKTTALAVNIECYPTHIAGLPVAVNISCHVTRHASIVL